VNNFPNNLRYLRNKKELIQEIIAPMLGIKRTTWSNYENGRTDPSIEVLIKISNFFGIQLTDLILLDLSAIDPLPKKAKEKSSGKRKLAVYKVNDTITYAAENEMEYVIKEIKKLREEIDFMKEVKK
jgi:DNA-binding XRE family transcriptional regulator